MLLALLIGGCQTSLSAPFQLRAGHVLSKQSTRDVTLVDVNHDGRPDAVSAGSSAGAVWLNQGGGQFQNAFQNIVGYGVALGKLNNDAHVDMYVARSGGNVVLFNNGAGVFSDSGQSLGSSLSEGVALADLDGDLDLDAFVANDSGQPNQVWLNDGSGTFTNSGQSLGAADSLDVALGDLNGDFLVDACVANNGETNTIWFNTGGGVFVDSGQSLGAGETRAIALGDIDGDGDLDAVVANHYSPNTVWTNRLGVFYDTGQDLGSTDITDIELADLDGDLDLDAYFANSDTYAPPFFTAPDAIWLNNGDGVFSNSNMQVAQGESEAVALGDVDQDGDVDVLVGNYGIGLYPVGDQVWINKRFFSVLGVSPSNGSVDVVSERVIETTFEAPVNLASLTGSNFSVRGRYHGAYNGVFSPAAGNRVHFTAAGGFDFAEPLEIIMGEGVLSQTGENLVGHTRELFVEALGCALFHFDTNLLTRSASSRAVAVGDVDGDGDIDAVIANSLTNKVWFNDGAGTFTDSGQDLGSFGWDVRLADLNGDGDLDIYLANDTGHAIWQNDGSGFFSLTQTTNLPSGRVDLGDLDGDGDLDAYVGLTSNDRILLNTGAGHFLDSGQSLNAGSAVDVALGDLDNDGDLDALVSGSASSAVWLNSGLGIFTNSGQVLDAFQEVALGDLNGDGWLDAVGARDNVHADEVLLNDGTGMLLATNLSSDLFAGKAVDLGDVDGDGNLDAFIAISFDDGHRLWLNDGAGAFTDSGARFISDAAGDVALADLDRDGDLDAFVVGGPSLNQLNKVYLNQGCEDDDGDGMGNHWEIANNTDPTADDAGTDNDGDGDSNLAEYIADTAANDSNDFFRVDGLTIMSPAEIAFDAATGRLYTVEYDDDLLTADDWQVLSNDVVGVAGTLTVSDPASTNQRNYRVRVRLAD